MDSVGLGWAWSDSVRFGQISNVVRFGHICSDSDRYGRNRSGLIGFGRTCSDLFGLGQIWSDLVGFGQIWSDLVRLGGTRSDLVGFCRSSPWEGTLMYSISKSLGNHVNIVLVVISLFSLSDLKPLYWTEKPVGIPFCSSIAGFDSTA